MSRTDVHAPAWVKERDPAWRGNYIEAHNHSWYVTGHTKETDKEGRTTWKAIWARVESCDLDVYLAATEWVRTACQMQYVHSGRNIFCGCKTCTGQISRRQTARADRHKTKRLLRSGRWENLSAIRKQRY